MTTYDLAIVGAGIVGLAHALAAAKRGKRVIVIDRDAQSNGASIRNFGFVTVTGQGAGDCWTMARRSREVWAEVAPKAGIPVLQRGLVVAARYPESDAVIDAFLDTEMGGGCRRLTAAEAAEFVPALRTDGLRGALYSPHELRVESKEAIPRLARWLEEAMGVTFLRNTQVLRVTPPQIRTATGVIEAEAAIVCPGDDYTSLFAERIAAYRLTRCKLHMMRVTPAIPARFATAVMSDLGLARYLGYAELPAAAPLKARLDTERAEARGNGVHLIVTQSADGSLVVGDTHHYATTPDPFAPASVDALVLEEFDQVLDLPGRRVSERWIGTYASAPDRWRLTDAPEDAVRIVIVTSGTGASTSFGIAEETIADLYGA
ncbi:TIGR03364 family FAD-dependent oxidoreductase [Segnochrobactraceae bacterium EtOH-i3]